MLRGHAKACLKHPAIHISELQQGLWIELGDEPSLYPVEEGVPELPKPRRATIRTTGSPMRTPRDGCDGSTMTGLGLADKSAFGLPRPFPKHPR
jgi:hypothetical protein